MTRARQWQPLCEADPTPGEPDEVTKAGRHYSAMSDEIDGQVQRLKDIVSGTLQGGYVQSLTAAAEGLTDELGRTSGRYREVGGTLQQWAPQLGGFQDEAERLRQAAVAAQGEMSDNRELSPVMAPEGAAAVPDAQVDAQVAATKARAGRYDDARDDLRRIQKQLIDLTDRRDSAAAKVADVIRDGSDDNLTNNLWDDFKVWMDDHAELVKGVTKVLGVVAMAACVVALVVPGLNIVAAAALVASAGSLLGHTALAATENGSWFEVGMDVFALATLGAGRFLGPGVKVFGRRFGGALKGLAAEAKSAGAMARGNTARGPIQARINADVLQSEQLLVGGASKAVRRSVRREVQAIRSQGTADSQRAFDAAETAYQVRVAPTTFKERLLLGGGDPDLAKLRVQAQDAALGFSSTSRVGLAAAKADAQYLRSVVPTAASNLTAPVDTFMDQVLVKGKDEVRSRSVTREGGSL